MTALLEKSPQEIFDVAYRGMRKQEFVRSATIDGRCHYRSPDGKLKCAIGHCITDEEYEQLTFKLTPVSGLIHDLGYHSNSLSFLNELQQVHDDNTSPCVMKKEFKVFAKKYGLTIPGEDE